MAENRLIENIKELNDEENIIDNIKIYSYNFQNDSKKRYGINSQQLHQISPDLVINNDKEEIFMNVDYTGIICHLIHKIHQLEAKVNKLCELLTA